MCNGLNTSFENESDLDCNNTFILHFNFYSTDFEYKIASLPKVIWEEGRVAALSHTYAVKSFLG